MILKNDISTLILDRLDTGLVILDPSLTIIFWNRWMVRYTGKTKDSVLGYNLLSLYPGFDSGLYRSMFEQVLKNENSFFCSGALHPLLIPPASKEPDCRLNLQIEAVKNADQTLILLQGFDITNQQKRVRLLKEEITRRTTAEEALRESNEQLRLMTRNMHDVVLETNSSGIYTYISPSHLIVLGRGDEVIGQSCFEHIHPEDIEYIMAKFEKALSDKNEVKAEYRYQHPEKGYIFLESICSTYKNRQNETVVLITTRDVTERRIADENIRYMSFHDKLTGLYNRAYLDEEMEKLESARQIPVSIIMADINGLKLVNDTYGHLKGDELLKIAAQVVRSSCREEDIVGRWGGDEFLIILPQTGEEDSRAICKRILESCSQNSLDIIPLSLSLGLAVKTESEMSLPQTLKIAEEEMYRQKLTESRSAKGDVLNSLVNSLSEKSFETEKHIRSMQKIAKIIGRRLNLSTVELKRLSLLINFHDIGKINIAEELLCKDGPLSGEEWSTIKEHPVTGYRIARASEDLAHIADEILAHHEHWNGEGYPFGLKGEEIPLLTRIISIADAIEVMQSGRPYKAALEKNEIIEELKIKAGSQFDPYLVKLLLTGNDVFL